LRKRTGLRTSAHVCSLKLPSQPPPEMLVMLALGTSPPRRRLLPTSR
jgi:hypothetical protein